LNIPKESIVSEVVSSIEIENSIGSILPEMETIDETEESTTPSTEELNQLIQQLQQELIVEDKRHFDTLAYFKNRIQEEQDKHSKKQHFLET